MHKGSRKELWQNLPQGDLVHWVQWCLVNFGPAKTDLPGGQKQLSVLSDKGLSTLSDKRVSTVLQKSIVVPSK